MRRLARAVLFVLLAATPARAGVAEPEARANEEFDFMNVLARHGWHNLVDERWNAYGQLTWISSFKLPFDAPYTNYNGSPNSLSTGFEHSYTGTATLYLGLKLWRGAEVYWVPEYIAEVPLSGLHGLGGVIQNFELQKQGAPAGVVYSSRLYFRQTIGFGGERAVKTSDPMQLGTTVDGRRLVFTVGNFSALDFFDKNSFAGDLRRQFFNMAFLTYAAYDFAADARGYTWGALGELYLDGWAVRVARVIPPRNPNDLPLDFRFWDFYGDQIEVEHAHSLRGLPGAIRILGYRNHENMGRFDEALAAFQRDPSKNAAACGDPQVRWNYGSANAGAPDLCWVRHPNAKLGIGLNLEQAVYRDIGLFLRAMYSDGQTEVFAFTSTDRSLSFGALARGSLWRRPKDFTGVGVGLGWISKEHADYLRAGGVDGFIGDGKLNPAAETVVEFFYGVNLVSSIWLSGDYQFIANPAFNADRGPLHILAARLHAEF